MKNLNIIVSIVALMFVTSIEAHVSHTDSRPVYGNHDAYNNRVDQRQFNQRRRIEKGIYSGRLTPWELEILSRQQNKIARLEQHFKSDGRLSWKERQILENKQDWASRQIYQMKNNDRRRPMGHNYYGYNR